MTGTESPVKEDENEEDPESKKKRVRFAEKLDND